MTYIAKCYAGKILRVNLSTGETGEEPLSEEMVAKYVGGRGLAAKMLYDEVKAGTDPLSAENKMIFSIGPLAGTPAQSCSRWIITTKSPLTGTYFRSVAGGGLGLELKKAGFDILVVEGKADAPSYLWIDDGKVEIRSAEKFVGMKTQETTDALREELGSTKIKVANVGPAAENLVLYSVIYDDERVAARGGVGAVMWSKGLKAIAVRGVKKKFEVADRKRLMAFTKKQSKILKETPPLQMFSHIGTALGVQGNTGFGVYPIRNFQTNEWDGVDALSHDKIEEIFEKDAHCTRCHIHCGRFVKVTDGPLAGKVVKGPEYEAMYSLGSALDVKHLNTVLEANWICDQYGLDTITAGMTIAFAMECFEKGILTKDDTDGLDLSWGNNEAVISLLKKVATRDGIGDILADGSKKAAERIGKGAIDYSISVKGMEIPGYDPRGMKGSGLNNATSFIGGSHALGQMSQEFFPPEHPEALYRFADEGKGEACKYNQNTIAIYEMGIGCIFIKHIGLVPISEFIEMIHAATGVDDFGDEKYMYEAGERTCEVERAFNVREGFTRKDDRLPKRFLTEPHTQGITKGSVIDMDVMLDDYYRAREWDLKTGYSNRAKLEKLGLGDIADELAKMGKLSD
ncbi:MAG: aldehyde ferredoxin oxidoreductase family protein [Proteobacteria bacterium]|nr:aldehyde ferredoxin oxidoreductase family protein [Pseudomonadota bacterium]